MTESKLQSDICRLLDRLNIVYVRSRMDKRSTTQLGTPDFLFAIGGFGEYSNAKAAAWEVKLPKQKLRPAQREMQIKMQTRPNAWLYSVITSLDDALNELKQIGIIQ